ncbi:U11/U12 small nuclear ribonucleoprotein 65 kDa protein-like [Phalaenopsis equestris]|uniref:U11/U12 small nuclear ribonucleoprotein 65 kDa protein-like n=1 Tax=Phalaenopsis equestris TaxID=78828 RepID=UPI0009E4DFFD|nr:U11/U12 small nuclear ribonucleoprotein 65 kDa protein-like [Phalaenopsis equestris]
MLSRLFSHYGASSVRPCAGGRLRNCAFVDFKDEALASQAHLQLNRLRFLGKVLTVDRADKATSININPQCAGLSVKDASTASIVKTKDASVHPKSLESGGEPIAPRLGVDYPFPPHLEYAYPPPDGNILTNIVNALIAVPNFYTQVLHLMNKMNLPAPFRMALPTPPLPPPIPAPPPPPPPSSPKSQLADVSSSESELESSEEDTGNLRARKRAKREAIVGPAVDKDVEHETVGLKLAALVPKEVPVIKKKNPVLQIKFNTKPINKDMDEDDGKISDPAVPTNSGKFYLTPEEISRGKMPPEEILSLPMFKNYATGNPATVLYIKNLAKDVVVDDFYFIFGSLFESVENAKSNLNIKLMQEGRMRGQAFVTFPTIDLAHRALNLVNGYLFKGKPIIIQFGRSPSVKTS